MEAAAPRYKIPRSVLVVIHTFDLRVLLIERAQGKDLWQSVTGSLDAEDEPLRGAALREVAEETGIDATIHELSDWQTENRFEIFARWSNRYPPGVIMNTEHVFGLALPTVVDVHLSPREHTDFVWLPYAQAASKCFSWSNRDAILQLPVRYGDRPARRDSHWM